MNAAEKMIACSAVAVALMGGGQASAQELEVNVEIDQGRVFVPIQSYAVGEVGSHLVFCSGLRDMGLHVFGEGAFPVSLFNDRITVVDTTNGSVFEGTIDHLSNPVQRALIQTAPGFIQFDDTLYLYGGYGPDGDTWTTRTSVTAIDLVEVRDAILASEPVPPSSFNVMNSAAAQVTGPGMTRIDEDRFVLVGGTNFSGEYATETEVNEYADAVHLFDRAVSMTTPVETFLDEGSGESILHRRDVNVTPVTLPDGQNTRPGFVVTTGAFQNGSLLWVNPLIWGDGDSEVTMDGSFIQHQSNYTTAHVNLFSESTGENRIIHFSGLSSFIWDGDEYVQDFLSPWTSEINELIVADGAFSEERIVGQMPWPLTNSDFIVDPSIATTSTGQILLDTLPSNAPVLIGRIYGGIMAKFPDAFPPTFPSDHIYNVFVTVLDSSGVAATLSDVEVSFGTLLSGGLAELTDADNEYVRVNSFPGFLAFEPNLVTIVVGAESDVQQPANFDVTIEAKLNNPGGTVKVSLDDWINGGADQIDIYSIGTSEQRVTTPMINATNYIRAADGRIEMELKYVVMATFTASGFIASTDQTEFFVRE